MVWSRKWDLIEIERLCIVFNEFHLEFWLNINLRIDAGNVKYRPEKTNK